MSNSSNAPLSMSNLTRSRVVSLPLVLRLDARLPPPSRRTRAALRASMMSFAVVAGRNRDQ
jgi:hypothetical protein